MPKRPPTYDELLSSLTRTTAAYAAFRAHHNEVMPSEAIHEARGLINRAKVEAARLARRAAPIQPPTAKEIKKPTADPVQP